MRFELRSPESLEGALDLLARHGDAASVLAGGQSLLILIRQGLVEPECVVDLARVPGLDAISVAPERVTVGAMATGRDVYTHPTVRARLGLLARACESVGPVPIHAVGTVAGSVAHNAPGADAPLALLALDANVRLRGPDGERAVALGRFLTGFFETDRASDELIVAIDVPCPHPGARFGYEKFTRRVMDFGIATVAVLVHVAEGGACREARIALGGLGAVPLRASRAEAVLVGSTPTPEALAEAGRAAAEDARERDLLSDLHASAEYRETLIPILVRRALEQAIDGAGEG